MKNHRILSLDSINWAKWHPQFEGTFAKTLYVDEGTGANLRQAFLPAGFQLTDLKRHHHGNTREGVFVLFGNVCYLEYKNPTIMQGREQNFREGFLLDRPPRSIHGPKIDSITDLGCLILEWGSGPLEFNYVPFEGNLESYGENFSAPLVVDSKTTPWQEHPNAPGLKIKPLSMGGHDQTPGFHPICLVHVPPKWKNSVNSHQLVGDKVRRWLYVLHGDLPIKIDQDGKQAQELAHLRENQYLEWFSPTRIVFNQNHTSEIGCVLLCVGHDMS